MSTITTPTRTVEIPARDAHDGHASIKVTLRWECPTCGGPRGEVYRTISYDGSRRLACDGWRNPCGHVDTYAANRREAQEMAPDALALPPCPGCDSTNVFVYADDPEPESEGIECRDCGMQYTLGDTR
jgi:Zn finger protein HypA/HybF involved in hydrogenase expression